MTYKINHQGIIYNLAYMRESITDGYKEHIRHTLTFRHKVFRSDRSLQDVVDEFERFIEEEIKNASNHT